MKASNALYGLGLALAGFSQTPDSSNTGTASDLEALFNTKVITASKFSENLRDAPGAISVVSKDELRRFGALTLREILEQVAGLTVASAYFTDRSIISARGDQTRQNMGHILLLINGRPVRETLEGGISSDLLESFPVGILERVEVIKGPGSVLYGSDAYSGVINLITKKAEGSGFHLSGAAGKDGAAATSAEATAELGDLKIVAAGQYHVLPDWNIAYRRQGAPQDLTIRNNGVGGYLGINYKGLSFMSSYTALEMPSFTRGIAGEVRWKRGFADLGYGLRANSKWEMTFNLTYTRSVLDAPDYPNIHRDSNEAVVEWTNFVTFTARDKLTFGALYNHIEGKEIYSGVTPALLDEDGHRSGIGWYVQHEHRLNDSFKLIGGLQANKIGSIALNVVPRGGLLWNVAGRHLTVKALYGGAFRAPSLDETGLNHPGLKGNPALVPEKIGTLDLLVSYQGNRAQWSAGYFHSRQTQRIIQDASTLPGHFYNLATAGTLQGFEGETKYYIRKEWFLTGSILYQTNEDGTGRKNVPPIPPFGAKAGISYLGANGAAVSLFDSYEGHVSGYAGALNPRPSAYHSVNAHLRFDFSKRWLANSRNGFALFVHGNNLAGRAVWLPAWGVPFPDTLPFNQGRTIYFGIEAWARRN